MLHVRILLSTSCEKKLLWFTLQEIAVHFTNAVHQCLVHFTNTVHRHTVHFTNTVHPVHLVHPVHPVHFTKCPYQAIFLKTYNYRKIFAQWVGDTSCEYARSKAGTKSFPTVWLVLHKFHIHGSYAGKWVPLLWNSYHHNSSTRNRIVV